MLVIAVPFLPLLGSVTTNSETSTPTNSPSAQANAELARLFPGSQGGSSSTLLFYGPNLTDANAQHVILNVSAAVTGDRSLAAVADVQSVYSQYAAYLAGQAEIAEDALQSPVSSNSSQPAVRALPSAVNATAELLWGIPAAYVTAWNGLVQNGSCPARSVDCNYPAYRSVASGVVQALEALGW